MYFFSTVNMIHQKEENNGVDSELRAELQKYYYYNLALIRK